MGNEPVVVNTLNTFIGDNNKGEHNSKGKKEMGRNARDEDRVSRQGPRQVDRPTMRLGTSTRLLPQTVKSK